MSFLSVTTLLHNSHDQVLSSHEGQFLSETAGDDLGVDDHALGDILEGGENNVGSEEGFWEGDTAVGTTLK